MGRFRNLTWLLLLFFFFFFFFFFFCCCSCLAGNVTYDGRSLIIDGHRKLLISASIHYPRSVPAMWPGLVQTAKEGGVDVIETYVFWNVHEPNAPGDYHFEGRFDLVKFVKIVQQAGMYLILRIGPFVAAEWNFGGVPVWLHYIPGTIFRTDNTNFKKFMTYIVNLMKQEKLFASQGGPIILAQVENEYGYYESDYGEAGKRYAMWAAEMAVSQNTGVPWIMCQQFDAPDSVINTCNSFYCDDFKPIFQDKPKLWTENWPGWFQTFGEPNPHRPPEDIAFSVARFFQKGGSLQNYYMYHGGTNFGRTAGGPFITTSYDYDAPIDEYGLPRFPAWGHLKELHKFIKFSEHVLLNGQAMNLSLGPSQEADVFVEASGACAAFLSNTDAENDATVKFNNRSYHLPAWSVSILPDCKNVAYNTAQVSSPTSIVEMIPEDLLPSTPTTGKRSMELKWEVIVEKAGIWGEADFVKNGLVDHVNATKDTTDYLWYTTSVLVGENEVFLKSGNRPVLVIESKGHALHAFANQQFQGSASGNGTHSPFTFYCPLTLKAGYNEIALLSMTVGLKRHVPRQVQLETSDFQVALIYAFGTCTEYITFYGNAGSFYEWVGAGLAAVRIKGFNNGMLDLCTHNWTYKIGLQGEKLRLYQPGGYDNVNWVATLEAPKDQPLTWYKAVVDAPTGDEPIGLDMKHMGKGLAWLNGEEIGRYWTRRSKIHDNCDKKCDYRGKFMPGKCRTGCGEPTQRWYHVPRAWFKPYGNVLVIFEEKGGDPTKVKFSRRKISGLCALIPENYPSAGGQSLQDILNNGTLHNRASVNLRCPTNKSVLSEVKFASFGTPAGTCGSYTVADCHDPNSVSVVEKACLNKSECSLEVGGDNFGKDLCPGTIKKLAVEAICS